jgi:DNA-directed RNA polymerase specialized sigma24 family protein
MREIQKMSYKDIADKVGINLSTLKSRIRNARQILIKDTKKEFEVLEEFYQ